MGNPHATRFFEAMEVQGANVYVLMESFILPQNLTTKIQSEMEFSRQMSKVFGIEEMKQQLNLLREQNLKLEEIKQQFNNRSSESLIQITINTNKAIIETVERDIADGHVSEKEMEIFKMVVMKWYSPELLQNASELLHKTSFNGRLEGIATMVELYERFNVSAKKAREVCKVHFDIKEAVGLEKPHQFFRNTMRDTLGNTEPFVSYAIASLIGWDKIWFSQIAMTMYAHWETKHIQVVRNGDNVEVVRKNVDIGQFLLDLFMGEGIGYLYLITAICLFNYFATYTQPLHGYWEAYLEERLKNNGRKGFSDTNSWAYVFWNIFYRGSTNRVMYIYIATILWIVLLCPSLTITFYLMILQWYDMYHRNSYMIGGISLESVVRTLRVKYLLVAFHWKAIIAATGILFIYAMIIYNCNRFGTMRNTQIKTLSWFGKKIQPITQHVIKHYGMYVSILMLLPQLASNIFSGCPGLDEVFLGVGNVLSMAAVYSPNEAKSRLISQLLKGGQ